MALKSKLVEVDGVGQVEVRELRYLEYQALVSEVDDSSINIGISIMKACIYINGARAFDNPDLGTSDSHKLFALQDEVLEVNGLGKPKSR